MLHNVARIKYDRVKILLSAYRHSDTQRHAEAGVFVEVLGKPMSHRKLDTVKSRTVSPQCSSTDTATAYGATSKPGWIPSTPTTPSAKQPSHATSAPNRPTLRTEGVLAHSGSAAPVATTSAPTSPTCPSYTPTSMICCAATHSCSPPPTSMTGHIPMRCPSDEEVRRVRRLIDQVRKEFS